MRAGKKLDKMDLKAIEIWERLKSPEEPIHHATSSFGASQLGDSEYVKTDGVEPPARKGPPRMCNCGTCAKCKQREANRKYRQFAAKKSKLRGRRGWRTPLTRIQ